MSKLNFWHWFWTGERAPIPEGARIHTTEGSAQVSIPEGWRHCDTCDKVLPGDARCDYDWSGNCSTGDFNWVRDEHRPVVSAKSELERFRKSLEL